VARTSEKKILTPIPDERQASRGWSLTIDGELVPKVHELTLTNIRFGTLRYGSLNGLYDCWCYHENGGGDAVIIPFCFIKEKLYVGVVEQNRPFAGGKVLNIPRGFLQMDESLIEGGYREATEELGVDVRGRIFQLPGSPGNCNSTFFNTAQAHEGDRFLCVRFVDTDLEACSDRIGYYKFRSENNPLNEAGEHISGCFFIPWQEAATVSDLYTNAAVARLLVFLKRDH